MDNDSATRLINQTIGAAFDKDRFTNFVKNLFNSLETSTFSLQGANIPEAYRPYVKKYERVGKYTDLLDNQIDVLVVYLEKGTQARTMQRNFVANYLSGSTSGKQKDAALVAFVVPGQEDWRLSLVKMEYVDFGKTKELTPARRYSFLVGQNENSHTAKQQLIPYLIKTDNILLTDLVNAFNVEKVSKEFFDRYKELFLQLKESVEDVVSKDSKVREDFTTKSINMADFAKKLLGQIVFLYFLQKKGWLGVKRDEAWGTGPKGFLRALFNKDFLDYKNFFNEALEPLFYEALAVERTEHYYDHLKSKIPFLNGGLFEPINDYDWVHTDINIPNELFSNQNRTKEGDVGTGILDVFDRYNFTVKEDEPLEKEVAVDPEMLGKVFENLLEIIDRKSKGSYYTPREIVHYMCQESLINYLSTELPEIPKDSTTEFIKHSDLSIQNDAQVERLGAETATYRYKLPESIRKNALAIDQKLADIKICDPAIGSGAFPVGMMNEIVRARESLTSFVEVKSHRTIYEFKRHAIQESLYGVDIDPGAVEIAKLRLWLSLVVDEVDIKQIKQLPNLDYKIMQGDSLLEEFRDVKLYDDHLLSMSFDDVEQRISETRSRILQLQNEYVSLHNSGQLSSDNKQRLDQQLQEQHKLLKSFVKTSESQEEKPAVLGLFDIASEARQKNDELKALHIEFFLASQKSTKDRLRRRIDEIEWELIEASLKEQGDLKALPQIEEYRQSRVKPFFLWKLHFSEVFRSKGGFDVLIANPPYVSIWNIDPKTKTEFSRKYRAAVGHYDLYVLFIERGISLLRGGGILSYITSNKYLSQAYGKGIRELLLENTIIDIVNFDFNVFDSASVETAVTVVSKTKPKPHNRIHTLDVKTYIPDIDSTSWTDISQSLFATLDNANFRINLTPTKLELIEKIRRNSLRVEDICYVSKGAELHTVKSVGKGKDEYIYEKKVLPGLKNYLEGKWFKKYVINKNQYLDYQPSEHKAPIFPEFFEAPKIIAKNVIGDSGIQAVYDEHGHYTNDALVNCILYKDLAGLRYRQLSSISPDKIELSRKFRLKYVLAIINSKLINWYFDELLGFGLHFYPEHMRSLPIYKASVSEQSHFEDKVAQLLKLASTDNFLLNENKQQEFQKLQNDIDKDVYSLYGLSKEDISMVERLKEIENVSVH